MKNSSNYSPKIIRLTENDLVKIIEKVILESKRDLLNENKKMEYSDFVEEAQTIHQHPKYIYPLASDITWDGIQKTKKIKIYCPIHQIDFYRTPFSHLYEKSSYGKTYPPKGCPECEKETPEERKERFMEKVIKYHSIPNETNPSEPKLKYTGYTEIEFLGKIKTSPPIKLFCPVKANNFPDGNLNNFEEEPHGYFTVSPSNHVNPNKKVGCPVCGGRRDTKYTWLDKIKSEGIHQKEGKLIYDYTNTDYVDAKTKVKIVCPKHGHGPWPVTPKDHLSGSGCPRCYESKGENIVKEYFKREKIEFDSPKEFEDCKGNPNSKGRCRKLKFDFYLPKSKIAIEIDGAFHFTIIKGSNLESQITNDKIKNKFVENPKTREPEKLIRIEYNSGKTDDLIKELERLLNQIEKLGPGTVLTSYNYPMGGWYTSQSDIG
jgi:hypothetical protein